jgi:hypothetical protein
MAQDFINKIHHNRKDGIKRNTATTL